MLRARDFLLLRSSTVLKRTVSVTSLCLWCASLRRLVEKIKLNIYIRGQMAEVRLGGERPMISASFEAICIDQLLSLWSYSDFGSKTGTMPDREEKKKKKQGRFFF
jgi:hypothetical protein